MWKLMVVVPGARKELQNVGADLGRQPNPKYLAILVSDWEKGDRTLAQFLLDPSDTVWVRAAELLDLEFSGARHYSTDYEQLAALRRNLYELNPEYRIRFHLITEFVHNGWRESYFVSLDSKSNLDFLDWRYHWTARLGSSPAENPQTTAFLLHVIYNWKYEYEEIYHSPMAIRLRAVNALIATWSGVANRDHELTDIGQHIKELVESTKLEPEIRLLAAQRLLEAYSDEVPASSPDLQDWEQLFAIIESDFRSVFGIAVPREFTLIEALTNPDEVEASLNILILNSAFHALNFVAHPRVDKVKQEILARPKYALRAASAAAEYRDLPIPLRRP